MGRPLLRQIVLASTTFALIAAGLPFPDVAAATDAAVTAEAHVAAPQGGAISGLSGGTSPSRTLLAQDRAIFGAVAAGSDAAGPASAVPRYRDPEAGVSLLPPRGWVLAPATSLDRDSDEQAFEVARFQVRVGEAALYAQPLPVTSGLLADAKAILSVSLAREGSDLAAADPSVLGPIGAVRLHGATAIDGQSSYEGVATISRVIVTTGSHRVALVRAYVPLTDRDTLAPQITAAIASVTIERDGPSGPRYIAPEPPAPQAVAQSVATPPDPSAEVRAGILARAGLLLGTPYIWGGNSPGRGMDCSAYVSAAWGVARHTTNSIWNVAVSVAKADLLPGDAMDLETWRDPDGYGHIRLFDAWADQARTLAWVYEETPPRAIHRVIAYDGSYTPLRLVGLSDAGTAPLIPAPAPQPVPHFDPGSGWKRPALAPAQPRVGQPWWWSPVPVDGRSPTGTRPPTRAMPPHRTPRPTVAPRRAPRPTPRPQRTPRPTAPPSAD